MTQHIHYNLDGTVVVAVLSPEPLPPLSGSQFMIALDLAGITDAQVHAAIDKIADPFAWSVARRKFQRSHEFERTHPLIETLGAAFGLTPAQIDTLWRKAAET